MFASYNTDWAPFGSSRVLFPLLVLALLGHVRLEVTLLNTYGEDYGGRGGLKQRLFLANSGNQNLENGIQTNMTARCFSLPLSLSLHREIRLQKKAVQQQET